MRINQVVSRTTERDPERAYDEHNASPIGDS
jgi:hypothetical protein